MMEKSYKIIRHFLAKINKTQRDLSPLRRILLNYAEFIIGVICPGENIEYCCTSDTVVINDKYLLLTLHRFTEDCDLSHFSIKRVNMSLLLEGFVIIANHITRSLP